LSKSYNLQFIEMENGGSAGIAGLAWKVALRFPISPEYRGLSEVDIYGLVRDRLRPLPELWEYTEREAESTRGLFRVTLPPFSDGRPADCETVEISMQGSGGGPADPGWQNLNPSELRRSIINMKRQILTGRLLGQHREAIPK
jgi:hypothetical protein